MILDVHTRLEMPDSLRLCRKVEPSRPFFIEDPLRSEDPASYEMLRLRTAVPLAAGEQFGSKWVPPALPGLGVEFDREAATGRPFRRVELSHLRRPDGSVTNW